MTLRSLRAASASGTWVYGRVVRVERQLDVCEGERMSLTYRLRGQEISIHPELPQPACLDEMTWSLGRTHRKFDLWDMTRLYGLCKTGILGPLAARGGHRSRRYRRLGPRRDKLGRLASFRRSSCYSCNEAGQLQRRVMHGSKPKLLISHQSEFAYYM